MGKNWDYSKVRGRELRLDAELKAYQTGAAVPAVAPFFSHCGTMQSFFNRGWHGVSQCDIRVHIDQATANKHNAPSGADKLSKIRSIRQCHSL